MSFSPVQMLQGMKKGGQGAAAGLHLGDAAGLSAGHTAVGAGSTFSQIFDDRLKGNLSAAQAAHQQKAEKAAGDLTANALILPMLKQVRRSPWAQNNVYSGGIGEKTFGPEFDKQIADRIAHSPRLGIKTALANKLANRNTAPAMNTTNVTKLDVHG